MLTEKLLIEIGCEELPSQQISKISRTLFDGFIELGQKSGVVFTEIECFGTPRRIALLCVVSVHLPENAIYKQGPFLDQAVDSAGQPTAAGAGFAKSCGVQFQQLEQVSVDGRKRLVYQTIEPGVPTETKILAWLHEAHRQMRGCKMMRWHDFSIEFPRPVHWVMIRLGAKHLAGSFLTCATQGHSHGHRFMHDEVVEIDDLTTYATCLQHAKVWACANKRTQVLQAQVAVLLPQDKRAMLAPELLAEVVGLVEWPVAILCQFEPKFLDLPEDLLIEVMRVHQKCFPVRDPATNKLQPYFIAVANIESSDQARVIAGNERVMGARLADAAFFFTADQKVTLEQRANQLAQVMFQAALGSLLDKTLRVQGLATAIAHQLSLDEPCVATIAGLAKADLCSETVGEFPDLHAIIGAELASRQGLPDAVVVGIREQVHPKFSRDRLPGTSEAMVVAIADRVDTLAGLFGMQCMPTGDRDPLGLRRAAMGVVRMVVEGQLPLDLELFIDEAQQGYGATLVSNETTVVLLRFLMDRFRVWWTDQGEPCEIFAAVSEPTTGKLFYLYQKMLALKTFIKGASSQAFLQANKRTANLLKKHHQDVIGVVDVECFLVPQEHDLHAKLKQTDAVVSESLTQHQYTVALDALVELVPYIDAFFDQCLILADEAAIRQNRLSLLAMLQHQYRRLADFSLLV